MTAFLQNCLNGISIGSIYALIAIGYTMVYGILRLINFAHGDIFMMVGYFMIICMTDLLIPWYISLLLVVLFTVLLGVFIERIAYKPLRDAPRMSIMISAIGVSYFLQNFATYLFTAQPKSYPYAEMGFLSKTVKLGEISTTLVTFITPILTVILVLALAFLIRKTKIGMAMRGRTYDIIGFRRVPPGLSGGVSSQGTFGGAAGALLLGLGGGLLMMDELNAASLSVIGVVAAWGMAGMVVDSLLGGVLQARYRGPEGLLQDRPNTEGKPASGRVWMTNDRVNLLSNAVVTGLAILLWT